MRILEIRVHAGPNIWTDVPVHEARVVFEEHGAAGASSALLGQLARGLPGLAGKLLPDASLCSVLAEVALELQSLCATSPRFSLWPLGAEAGTATVVVEFEEEAIGRSCLESARGLIDALLRGAPFDLDAEVARLRDIAYFARLGPSTKAIVDCARARGIPFRRLNQDNLIQLGHGARQRRIMTAETDRTGAVAQSIAQDKELTRSLLEAVGVPVPEGRLVESAEDAWSAAEEIEGPVVVKPRDGNHGRGVFTNLSKREEIEAAYASALAEGNGVLVESYSPGADHRLLVVGGRMVAAALREPAHVVGDGVSSIEALVARANLDPLRGDGFVTPLKAIALDDVAREVLSEQGLTFTSVPPSGTRVLVGRKINYFFGGTSTDVTERVHPTIAAQAVDAARVVGLDVAGIDVVATEISLPLEQQKGSIVEVNAGPGLQMHLFPSAPPRPVGDAIVDLLFPGRDDGRIPTVAVLGPGSTETARLIATLLSGTGAIVGFSGREGRFVGSRRISARDSSGHEGIGAVFLDPSVQAAVLELDRDDIVTHGLAVDRCGVAVVPGCRSDVVGVRSAERTLFDHARVAVLLADDPLAADALVRSPDDVVLYGREEHHASAIGCGYSGRFVVARRDEVVLSLSPKGEHVSIPFRSDDPMSESAAIAALWALGTEHAQIRELLDRRAQGDWPSGPNNAVAQAGLSNINP